MADPHHAAANGGMYSDNDRDDGRGDRGYNYSDEGHATINLQPGHACKERGNEREACWKSTDGWGIANPSVSMAAPSQQRR